MVCTPISVFFRFSLFVGNGPARRGIAFEPRSLRSAALSSRARRSALMLFTAEKCLEQDPAFSERIARTTQCARSPGTVLEVSIVFC
jgi:hypothetical protein